MQEEAALRSEIEPVTLEPADEEVIPTQLGTGPEVTVPETEPEGPTCRRLSLKFGPRRSLRLWFSRSLCGRRRLSLKFRPSLRLGLRSLCRRRLPQLPPNWFGPPQQTEPSAEAEAAEAKPEATVDASSSSSSSSSSSTSKKRTSRSSSSASSSSVPKQERRMCDAVTNVLREVFPKATSAAAKAVAKAFARSERDKIEAEAEAEQRRLREAAKARAAKKKAEEDAKAALETPAQTRRRREEEAEERARLAEAKRRGQNRARYPIFEEIHQYEQTRKRNA